MKLTKMVMRTFAYFDFHELLSIAWGQTYRTGSSLNALRGLRDHFYLKAAHSKDVSREVVDVLVGPRLKRLVCQDVTG